MNVVVPDEFKYLYETNSQRPVLKIPEPILRQQAREITKVTKKIRYLAEDMIRIMKKANGIGLAAPQVGVSERLIVIAPHGTKPMPLINPVVVSATGEMTGEEGCLSIPGLYGDVVRPSAVEVEAYDLKGRPIAFEMEGMAARVVQHEIDHLNGILFIDKVIVETLHWQNPETAKEDAE